MHGGVVHQQLFLPLPAGVRHGNGGQQAAGVGVDGVGRQLFGPGQLHDAALVDDGDAVGDVAHHGKIVGDEQVGDAAFLLQAAQQVQHLCTDGHIQCADGLIGNDELRLHDQRPGDTDALALSAGKFVRKAGSKFRQQAHVPQSLPYSLLPLGGGEVGPDVLQALAHDVAHLGALVQRGLRVLKDHLDLFDDLPVQLAGNSAVDLLALIKDLAAGGGQNAQDGAANGSFAAAAFAYKAEGLALINFKVGILHSFICFFAGAVGYVQVVHFHKNFAFIFHLTAPPLAAFSPQQEVPLWVPGGPAAMSWPCGWAIR